MVCQGSGTALTPRGGGCAPLGPPAWPGSLCPGSLLGPQSQHEPYTQQVPVPLQGNTYLQELDTVAGSPDGENDVKGPSGHRPLQHRFSRGTGVTFSQEGRAGCSAVGVF